MGEGSAGVVWFAASGFRVLAMNDTEIDVVIDIETEADRVGCHGCGVIARAKDRRWVTVRDAPAGDRPVTLRWWKQWPTDRPAPNARYWRRRARKLVALPMYTVSVPLTHFDCS